MRNGLVHLLRSVFFRVLFLEIFLLEVKTGLGSRESVTPDRRQPI